MDPQATWDRLIDAYRAGERDEAQDAADTLLQWLDRGGFPPQTLPGRSMDDAWNRALARAACCFVLQQPEDRES